MPLYSEKVMDHFMHPRNVGEIENPDGIGEVGNPVCGDMMTFYIKVKDGHLEDVKFKTFGCGAAIAVSSMVSELAIGKTLDEAMKINARMVAAELDGLPKNKLHCSNLGDEALHKAIEDYLSKQRRTGEGKTAAGIEPATAEPAQHCYCPYCDEELVNEELPYCQACRATLKFCSECGQPVSPDTKICPHCGAEIKG
ncbi:MAG: Fe-S cluster assembly scaffold protein NifU [Chloroflexi bacterium]|nr:Fe-S cluster assembly scaffold protein NifU [Chloroflexota bacterium]